MTQFLRHFLHSLVWAATIGGASMVCMILMIDGAPMLALAMAGTPFGH